MSEQRNCTHRVLLASLLAVICLTLPSENAVPVLGQEESLRIADAGSEEANITDFPYAVALYKVKQTARDTPFCTGSILHKNWVLTAAHCVTNPPDARYYQVKAGYDKLSGVNNPLVQTRIAVAIERHPKYWSNKVSKYDVALIKVEDFDFNDRVNRILPYAKDWSALPKEGDAEYAIDTCQAVGWGSIEINVPSDSLRYANITVRHGTAACKCFQMYMQRRLLCSDATEMKGICPGDSGGPLVCNGSVAGVAHIIYHRDSCKWDHFGRLELRCNSPKIISAWMFVCPMLDFINQYVPDMPSKPATCMSPAEIGLSTLVAGFSALALTWAS